MKFNKTFVITLLINKTYGIKISDDDNGMILPAIVDEHDNFIDRQNLA